MPSTDSSHFNYLTPHRPLRPEEIALIEHLAGDATGNWNLKGALVEDMEDGGMGSIRFLGKDGGEHQFGQVFAECEYTDVDGVEVLITLGVDQEGYPFELDLWKVDFMPLRRYATKNQVKVLKVRRLN